MERFWVGCCTEEGPLPLPYQLLASNKDHFRDLSRTWRQKMLMFSY